jgi:hypothetical protein
MVQIDSRPPVFRRCALPGTAPLFAIEEDLRGSRMIQGQQSVEFVFDDAPEQILRKTAYIGNFDLRGHNLGALVSDIEQ